jgi:adenylate cyclase
VLLLILYFYYYYRRHTQKIKKMLGIKIEHYEKKVNHYKTETFAHKQEAEKAKTEKEKLQDLFNKFADQEIVKEIVSQPDLANGEEREITVMFADLCDFTQLCEKIQLSSIREILNEYFESMYLTVKKNHGVVNEYLGDALFVLFNAPNRIANHPLAAIKTALAMKEELKNLNQKLAQKGHKPLEISIGLNTGKAKIGLLGVNRIKYAAIGDTVNTAARLEGEAKHGEILICQETYDLVQREVEVQPLGLIKVKHKEVPLRVYKVLGLKSRVI